MSWQKYQCATRAKTWGDVTEEDLAPLVTFLRQTISRPAKTQGVDKGTWIQVWRMLADFVAPYEADREAYDTPPTAGRPILLHPFVWHRLSGEVGPPLCVSGFQRLGFAVADNATGEPMVLRREDRRRRLSGTSQSPVNMSKNDPTSRSVSFETEGPPVVTIPEEEADDGGTYARDLEDQIRVLTKTLQKLKSKEAVTAVEPTVTPTTALIASTVGGTVVPIQVSCLEPDFMPYCISLSMTTERRIVPCTILDHQYLVFVAPPHPVGSVSVTILCGPGPVLRRYCKSVWLEYRSEDSAIPVAPTRVLSTALPTAPLTHHQVNQISAMSHIQRPIQSVQDTSEGVGEAPEGTNVSNYTSDVGDGNDADSQIGCSDDGDAGTAQDVPAAVAAEEAVFNAPLTRDMLELLTRAQNFFLQPVSRMQYSVSVQDNRLNREREPLPDDVVSQVSYCATNNSVIPPTSPKEMDRSKGEMDRQQVPASPTPFPASPTNPRT